MTIPEATQKLKSLSLLRKRQRPDKSKSGKKQPRTFDVVPLEKELNYELERERIQEDLAIRLNYKPLNDKKTSKRKLAFVDDEDSCDDNIETEVPEKNIVQTSRKRKVPFEDSLDLDLVLSETGEADTTEKQKKFKMGRNML